MLILLLQSAFSTISELERVTRHLLLLLASFHMYIYEDITALMQKLGADRRAI